MASLAVVAPYANPFVIVEVQQVRTSSSSHKAIAPVGVITVAKRKLTPLEIPDPPTISKKLLLTHYTKKSNNNLKAA
jgi:hypothetical protein